MSRSKLNSTTDEALEERVVAVACVRDGPHAIPPPMLAPFITNDVLHRLHEVSARMSCCNLAMSSVLSAHDMCVDASVLDVPVCISWS